MNIFRQPPSERWEQLQSRGFWRHTLVEGVLLVGVPFFVVTTVTALLDLEATGAVVCLVPFFLVGGLGGGFVVGVVLWFYDCWCPSRYKKRTLSR
jgi:hypothetical protein